MTPEFEPAGVKKTEAWEYAVRFVFGGVVTVCTGLVAQHFGPGVGGLFLAFPAILPASLTLVKRHDGRMQAVDDARGARLGSIGLAAFALATWVLAPRWPAAALVLTVATLAWAVVSVAGWMIVHGRRRSLTGRLGGPATARRRGRSR